MKKSCIVLILLILVSCSSGNESQQNVVVEESVTPTSTTTSSDSSEDTTTTSTTDPVFAYNFDVEKMSPFTGKELPPEIWLLRPKRVIAFKIDNNINARPQSGLQEADAVHEVLVEGGMTRFLAFYMDKTSSYVGPILSLIHI